MAKDGTNRGGLRIGAGKKSKSLDEKILEGKVERLIANPVINPSKSSVGMPEIKKFMTARQRNDEKIQTAKIYEEMWNWLGVVGKLKVNNTSSK